MPNNLTTKILAPIALIPILGIPARLMLYIQELLWRKKPKLTERLSNFLPIGGVSTVIQAVTLFVLVTNGMTILPATIIAVQASVFFNFTANRLITWNERFVLFTRRQSIGWFLPLFIVFDLTTPSVLLKIVGLTSLEHFLGIPLLLLWILLEGIGTVLNYLGADHISFGVMTYIMRRICRTSASNAYQTA